MAYAGFDTSVYPGDAVMQVARTRFPYSFCAYYLHAPCHHSNSWMGKREKLAAQGWNCLIVYVGQQVEGVSPCDRANLTEDQGGADAKDAATLAAAEGFASGSAIYLDVERFDPTPAAAGMPVYVEAWVKTMLGLNFRPAIYCHKFNAPRLRQVVLDAGADVSDTSEAIRFWVVGSGESAFSLFLEPSASTIDYAYVWQSPTSISQRFGACSIGIDENVACHPDPSAPC